MFCGQKLDQMNAQVFKCAYEIEVMNGDDVIWYMKSLIRTLNCFLHTSQLKSFMYVSCRHVQCLGCIWWPILAETGPAQWGCAAPPYRAPSMFWSDAELLSRSRQSPAQGSGASVPLRPNLFHTGEGDTSNVQLWMLSREGMQHTRMISINQ